MKELVQRFLGVDVGTIPEDARLTVEWTNLPQSWEVFLLIGVVGLLVYLVLRSYRQENDQCPVGMKRFLTGLRLCVLFILLLIYLGPSLTYVRERTLQPVITLLRDASYSMNLQDGYADEVLAEKVAALLGSSAEAVRREKPKRAALVDRALNQDEGALLAAFAERGRLRLIDFAERPTEVEWSAPEEGPFSAPVLQPTGQGTDLLQAVREGLADKMTAAQVLFTDGQHNARSDLRQAGEESRKKGVPLFIVGTGDPQRPRNLEIAEIYADPLVWANDPFEIQATLRNEGFEARSVDVELLELVADGDTMQTNVLKRLEAQLAGDNAPVRLRFSHQPSQPGKRYYTVRALPLDNERSAADNQPDAPVEVRVLNDKARVLMIAGEPSWEFRHVQKLLTVDKTIDLSVWLQTMDRARTGEGNTPISRMPATREELFAYDAVLLFDPDPQEFDQAGIDLLRDFVREHSGGLLYLAGPRHAARFIGGTRTGGIKDVLPVTFGDLGRIEVSSLLAVNNRDWPLGIIAANVDQPIMRMHADPQASFDIWASLPGIYWSFPAELPKPAARVLIEHSDPTLQRKDGSRPLLVTGHYGSGRTVYVGFTGSWLWRSVGHNAEYFNRFWVQSARYLVEGRAMEGKRRGVVEADRERYRLGDRVLVSGRIKDERYQPLAQAEIKGSLSINGKEEGAVTLSMVPEQPGFYQASIMTRKPGRHNLRFEIEGGKPVQLEAGFSVSLPNVEQRETWLNQRTLAELAERSGGAYFQLDEMKKLATAIPDRTQRIEIQGKPVVLWDTGRVLLLLVALLCIEWALRKRFKLI